MTNNNNRVARGDEAVKELPRVQRILPAVLASGDLGSCGPFFSAVPTLI
jgi:hypothetical protein